MKDRYVADTMAVVLRLEKRRISMHVKEVFVRAEAGHVELFIPVMVLADTVDKGPGLDELLCEERLVLSEITLQTCQRPPGDHRRLPLNVPEFILQQKTAQSVKSKPKTLDNPILFA